MYHFYPRRWVQNVLGREYLTSYSMRIIFYCVYPLINRLYQCEEMIMRITHLQKSIPLREILQPPNHAINTCLRRVAKLLLKFQQGIPVKGIVVVDICRDDILLISIQKKPDMFFTKPDSCSSSPPKNSPASSGDKKQGWNCGICCWRVRILSLKFSGVWSSNRHNQIKSGVLWAFNEGKQ